MAGKIIITEGAAPSAPVGAGKHTVYIDSADDKLKIKNEADDVSVIATEAGVGALVIATDGEINTGTSTTKCPTVKQVKDNFLGVDVIVGGTIYTLTSLPSERTSYDSGNPWEKKKSITIPKSGTYTVSFKLNSGTNNQAVKGRIYKNGVAFGTERTWSVNSYSSSISENLAFTIGDTCELYLQGNYGAATCYSKDFLVTYELSNRPYYIGTNALD